MPQGRTWGAGLGALLLAGCATGPGRAPVAAPPVVATIAPPPPAMPAGAFPGMRIPARLGDGSWPTPNRALSDRGAIWHLRGALNVAALACREGGDPLVTPYNAWLARARAELAAAERGYADEWRATGPGGQDRYDDAMTRLYNFYGQSAMRPAFCQAAAGVLAETGAIAPADLPGFARERLARIDRVFTDFYTAFDAWRASQQAPATAAPIATTPVPASRPAPLPQPEPAQPAQAPRLAVDPAVLRAE